MEKMNCDIIQDLIPSYVDEICSDATRIYVEKHLTECDNCKKIADLCKRTAFSGVDLESRQLDGLKKWSNKIRTQNLFSYILLLFMISFGLYTFTGNPTLSIRGYYILFAVCLIGTFLFTTHMGKLHNMKKTDLLLTLGSVLLSIISMLTIYLCFSGTQDKQLPFGLAPQKLGPFISNILLVCFLLQLLSAFLLLLRLFKRSLNTLSGLCAALTGSFLTLGYRTLLDDMSPIENLQDNVLEITLVILGMGIIGILLMKILYHHMTKSTVSILK